MRTFRYQVLRISPTQGVLDAHTSQFLHITFTPIEEKKYEVPIRISLLENDTESVIECLDFDLTCEGFDPRLEHGKTPFFPDTLPLQTYAPLPNYGAALSTEAVNFGHCPLHSVYV